MTDLEALLRAREAELLGERAELTPFDRARAVMLVFAKARLTLQTDEDARQMLEDPAAGRLDPDFAEVEAAHHRRNGIRWVAGKGWQHFVPGRGWRDG